MNRQTWRLLFIALVLIAGTGGLLVWSGAHQHLGPPGIKATAIPGSQRMELYLPSQVLDYRSQAVPTDPGLLKFMPPDSSFIQRLYEGPDGFQLVGGEVLMGTDRTSIHKPQFCLVGQGFELDERDSTSTSIRILRPAPYDLPVMKLITTREARLNDGRVVPRRGVYVYWFVADGRLTSSHNQRMLEMAWQLFRTGVLQRWAYITCFAECEPGAEAATFQRMEKFIQAAVPEFQLATGALASASAGGVNSMH